MRTSRTICRLLVVVRSATSLKKAHCLLPSLHCLFCPTSTSFLQKITFFLQRSESKMFLLKNIDPLEIACVFRCFISFLFWFFFLEFLGFTCVLIWGHCAVITLNNAYEQRPHVLKWGHNALLCFIVCVHFHRQAFTQRMKWVQINLYAQILNDDMSVRVSNNMTGNFSFSPIITNTTCSKWYWSILTRMKTIGGTWAKQARKSINHCGNILNYCNFGCQYTCVVSTK